MPDEPVALAHIKLAWHCAVLASICADVTPISATAMLVLRSMLGERRGRWQRASAEALVKSQALRRSSRSASRAAAALENSECVRSSVRTTTAWSMAWSSLRHQGAIPALDRLFRSGLQREAVDKKALLVRFLQRTLHVGRRCRCMPAEVWPSRTMEASKLGATGGIQSSNAGVSYSSHVTRTTGSQARRPSIGTSTHGQSMHYLSGQSRQCLPYFSPRRREHLHRRPCI